MASAPATLGLATPPLRDRIVLWGGIVVLSALAWIYLIIMPMGASSRLLDAALMFLMWAVMMVAMMLPSAAPMLATYARIASAREGTRAFDVWMFAGGYFVAWTVFSLAVTAVQYALQSVAIVSNGMRTGPVAGGIILLIAGIYQLTPWKNSCLKWCRTPIGFFMTNWRDGARGAFRMGLDHGAFCTGCCWMLMALLFVAGVMNLAWIAAISVLVLVEKAAPYGRAIARASGVAMIAVGLVLVIRY
jgi:predicted metal-binding membrane protein